MSKTLQRPRGTQDMTGDQAARFDHVIETFNRVRKLYGFGRVEVPVFEATSVFSRSLGETTDVVSKEMYSFEDRGGDSLTLRPEFTAGICRAYTENGWQQHAPMKLATLGPLFRYERPQKGRFRQFHQLDAEVIGAAEPAADVEVIALAQQVLEELGVADRIVLQLNTMGDPATRAAWASATTAHFAANADVLSEESRRRLATNPLRILDSKEAADRELVIAAPDITAHMTSEAGTFFENVVRGLEASGIAWARNARLVRGLDYYRHTVFEFVTEALGAQGTVIGGGRYDGLIGSMGGPDTPAVGWAGGIERLAMLVTEPAEAPLELIVTAVDERMDSVAQKIAFRLRAAGIACDCMLYGAPSRRYDKAQRKKPRVVIWPVAPDSRQKGCVLIESKRGSGAGTIGALESEREVAVLLEKIGRVEYVQPGERLHADFKVWLY